MADVPPKRPRGNPNWIKGVPKDSPRAARDPRTSQELDVRALAQKWTPHAISVAAELMMNYGPDPNTKEGEKPKLKVGCGPVPHSVRLSAADLLLKRGHGNPIQPVANPDLTPLNFAEMSDEAVLANAARLDAILAKAGVLAGARKSDEGKMH